MLASAQDFVACFCDFHNRAGERACFARFRFLLSLVRRCGSFPRTSKDCARLPFVVKVGLRRDTLPQLEQIALFAARMGASGLSFGHLLPTSGASDEGLSLAADERTEAEQEIAVLAQILKMRVSIEVGYHNADPAPPCSALAGTSCNVDYRGRLSLCCNLSGYRGASEEADVVADLNDEAFAPAFERLRRLAEEQLARRRDALAARAAQGVKPDIYLGSPCLFCLKSFGKVPWHAEGARVSRALPVVQAV